MVAQVEVDGSTSLRLVAFYLGGLTHLEELELGGLIHTEEIGSHTNNFSEYLAVIAALLHLQSRGYQKEVEVYSDSQLIINQLNREWILRDPNLLGLWRTIKELEKGFSEVRYVWRSPNQAGLLLDKMLRRVKLERSRSK